VINDFNRKRLKLKTQAGIIKQFVKSAKKQGLDICTICQ